MIPPFALGRTPPPHPAAATVLDRVFPPDQCDHAIGDRWVVTGRSGLAYGAWSEPVNDRVAS